MEVEAFEFTHATYLMTAFFNNNITFLPFLHDCYIPVTMDLLSYDLQIFHASQKAYIQILSC